MRTILRMMGLGLVAVLAGAGLLEGRPPNVVVFLADDQGWGDLSIHGNTNLQTPQIDSLARDGALFDRFFVCPVCSPTRAEFLTGRYHPRGGVRGVSTGQERLDLGERTIAEVFRAAGYRTAAFGKWHNGLQSPYHPNDRGFEEFYGFCSGHWGDYFSPPLEHNGRFVRGKGFLIDDLTDHALQFIEQNKDRPFFCYLAYNTPHSPMQVPDAFWDRFKNKELALRHFQPQQEEVDFTRAALAMCENIDANVGRVLAKLDALQLREQTIVVYFSDNGPNSWRWNGGMKGRKGSTDEGGVRSPLLIRYPGKVAAGLKVVPIAGAIDLLPTLVELAGIPLAVDKPLDGKSLAPLLTGQTVDWPDRTLVQHWNGRLSLRTQRWRLDADGALFDLESDPGQRHDLAGQQPELAARLRKEAQQWRRELGLPMGRDTRPFTVGYAQTTPLPARDGVPHGQVRRSAQAPNCSYFTNWKSTEDQITWDIQVGAPGRYEAVVYYTCPAADVGSTVELSLGEARLRAALTEPHDPPAYGAEHDRVPRRGESYMKDFKPWRMGTLELPATRGTLTLRALSIPGSQVMEVRYVVLTRLP